MNRSLGASMALGCILTIPLFAFSAPGGAAPAMEQWARHHHVGDFAKAKAFVSPAPPALSKPETDGLSRDPNDCKFGCIDNGD